MSATQYDFSIDQGSSFKLSLSYNDSNNQPIDLTGWCARLSWITDEGSSFEFLTTNTDPLLYSFTITPLTGLIILQIPASITNAYDFIIAKYDLEIESSDEIYTAGGAEIIRLLFGNITLNKRYSENPALLDC